MIISLKWPKSTSTNLLLPRSPLIGRDYEVAAIQRLLLQDQVGLLTLTGPGGIGKTRLALQSAANLLDHFVDGVYFVSLASISDPELVSAAIAQMLGVRESAGRSLQESLHAYLHDKQLLLVLDNFEQIVAAAPMVGALLTACRRLKVLVTSRAALHLYGEHEFPVPPLALPVLEHLTQIEADPIGSLAQYAAVALFVQRAVAVKPDFALTLTNVTTVAKICIGLDGLPLAIELAAARVKLFPPPTLLARLKQWLTLLSDGPHDLPARQRTLRDEIAWSYDLLTEQERVLFRRLSVFADSFTVEAVEGICLETDARPGEPPAFRLASTEAGQAQVESLDLLGRLVDKSLVEVEETPHGAVRYRLLETIRQYAWEKLQAVGEAQALRKRHLTFFLGFAEVADLALRSPEQRIWLQRLDEEYNNLRVALDWSLHNPVAEDDKSDQEQGLRLTDALFWFWYLQALFSEGRIWFARALTLTGTAKPGPARATALYGDGALAWLQDDCAYAHAQLEESVALWRELRNQRRLAYALAVLACVMDCQNDLGLMRLRVDESVMLFRESGDKWGLALALAIAGANVASTGDYVGGRSLLDESLALFRQTKDTWGIALALTQQALTAYDQGDVAAAGAMFEEALAIRSPVEDKWQLVRGLIFLGNIARLQGDDTRATALYQQSLPLAREMGSKDPIATILLQLGFIVQQGQYKQAAVHFRESLALAWELHHKRLTVLSLVGLAEVAASEQQWERAAQLCGAAETAYPRLDRPFKPLEQADYTRAMATVRINRSEMLAAAWAQGQAMTLEQAVTYALAPALASIPVIPAIRGEPARVSVPLQMTHPLAAPLALSDPIGLTPREVEVLQWLVEGLTYAQIAEKLIISRRTVNTHVSTIYSKLGVTSRMAAIRFAETHHLL